MGEKEQGKSKTPVPQAQVNVSVIRHPFILGNVSPFFFAQPNEIFAKLNEIEN